MRNKNDKNTNFDEKTKKCLERKWKYTVAFVTMTGLKLSHCKL